MRKCRNITLSALLPMLFWLWSLPHAQGQGHYAGSSFNPNDYFIPASPGWVFSMYYSYSGTKYFNDAGSKTDQIPLGGNPPVTIKLGQKVTTHSVIPMFIHFGKGKVLGANWGFMVLPMLNNPNANIALDFYLGQTNAGNQNVSISSFGLGDMYVQPVWLTWEKKKFTTTASYGIWMPTGKYKPNSTENIGLGYWSHNLRLAGRYRVKPNIIATGAFTYEFNSKQSDVDFKEAPHLTFDYGGSYIFKMGHELGLMGFGSWQTGNDEGVKAVTPKDRIYGLGMYGSYWFKPGKIGMLARSSQNFGTRNRYGGFAFQLGVNYLVL